MAVAEIVKRIRLDLFALDTGKRRTGFCVAACSVQRDTATVGIREACGRIIVVTLFKFVRRRLFRCSEPLGMGNRIEQQAGAQQARTDAAGGIPGESEGRGFIHGLPGRYPGSVRRNRGNSISMARLASR